MTSPKRWEVLMPVPGGDNSGLKVYALDGTVLAPGERTEVAPISELQEALQLLRELRRFVPYEKPEQGPLPGWITEIAQRADDFLASRSS